MPPPSFTPETTPARSTFAAVAGKPLTTTSTAFEAVGVRPPHADVNRPTSPLATGRFNWSSPWRFASPIAKLPKKPTRAMRSSPSTPIPSDGTTARRTAVQHPVTHEDPGRISDLPVEQVSVHPDGRRVAGHALLHRADRLPPGDRAVRKHRLQRVEPTRLGSGHDVEDDLFTANLANVARVRHTRHQRGRLRSGGRPRRADQGRENGHDHPASTHAVIPRKQKTTTGRNPRTLLPYRLRTRR